MIKIGFIGALTKDWTGGINYFKIYYMHLTHPKKESLKFMYLSERRLIK